MTDPLIESIVAEFEEENTDHGGPIYPNQNSEWLREKLTHLRTLSIAEGEKIGREKVVEEVISKSLLVGRGKLGANNTHDDAWMIKKKDLNSIQASHLSYEK